MPEDEFKALVAGSKSCTAVLAKFGLQMKGGNWTTLKGRIDALGLSIAHFDPVNAAANRKTTLSADDVLIENSPHRGSVAKKKFRALGIVAYVCEPCGQEPIWQGKPLVLILDHRNGRNRDHRPENLRWICPNCDSQSDTFCGRNNRKA